MELAPYYRAAIPEPRTILGLKLKPLALGHIELLSRVQSPFVIPGKITYADLATAVLICSLTYEEALEAIDNPKLDRFMERWALKLCYPKLRHRWTGKAVVIDLPQKALEFQQYIEENSTAVNAFMPDSGDSDPINLPLHQVVKVGLMSYLNHTYSQAMNKPWGLALSDYFTWMAIEGRANIIEQTEYSDLQAQANAFHERVLKQWPFSPSSQN